ncbi:MAG TPA: MepB family protein [Brumimicrobium sp.]|nr:MepB family protein [Brumimicrobium sp.]
MSLINSVVEQESLNYQAHNLRVDELDIKFRKGKITPNKTGQFVTLWKRNFKGITVPYDLSDPIDFYIIATRKEEQFGAFIFPKVVLHKNKILSDDLKDGKRGIRVYPPWDEVTSKQAHKTQVWQTKYFIDFSNEDNIDLKKAKEVFLNHN